MFNVSCMSYARTPPTIFENADYITWWLGGLKINAQVLGILGKLSATLRPNAEAVILHDLRTGIDRISYEWFAPYASWIEEVEVPRRECELCQRAVAEKRLVRTHCVAGILLVHV